MEKELQLKDLYDGFRDAKTIKAFKQLIDEDLKDYDGTINIMEVCGGHTHTIMKYGIPQLINKKINLVTGFFDTLLSFVASHYFHRSD